MNKKLVIVGVGETAELAADYFTYDSNYEVVAFAAEQAYLNKHPDLKFVLDLPVVAVEELPERYPISEYEAFVAMSYVKLNHDRARFYNLVKSMGYNMASYISSRAFIGRNVSIGDNCFILENNVLQRNVQIGNDVTLWSGNHIGHRSIIKNHVFLSSHVAVSGFCTIGDYCFLGINSCLGDCLTIADNCWIGGGVTILKDTKPSEIYRLVHLKAERLSSKLVFGYEGD